MAEASSRLRKKISSWIRSKRAGYKSSTAILDNEEEFHIHQMLEKKYVNICTAHDLKKSIFSIARKSIRAVQKKNKVGACVESSFREYKPLLARTAMVAGVDAYCKMLREAEKLNRQFCQQVSDEVIDSLRVQIDDVKLKNSLLSAENYSKARWKMQKEYAEFFELLEDCQYHPKKANSDKLAAMKMKLSKSKGRLDNRLVILKALLETNEDQEKEVLESLSKLVKAEADYYSRLYPLLTGLEDELKQLTTVAHMRENPTAPYY